MGQPELNDLDRVHTLAATRKIPLVRLKVAEEGLLSGRILTRFPTGVSLVHSAASIEDVRRIMDAYKLRSS